MYALPRRSFPSPFRLDTNRDAGRDDSRNPYPPPPPPDRAPSTPPLPTWFQRYWPVALTITSFIAGLWFLNQDLRDGTVEVVPAIVYMTLMGYLPVAALAGLFKR